MPQLNFQKPADDDLLCKVQLLLVNPKTGRIPKSYKATAQKCLIIVKNLYFINQERIAQGIEPFDIIQFSKDNIFDNNGERLVKNKPMF